MSGRLRVLPELLLALAVVASLASTAMRFRATG